MKRAADRMWRRLAPWVVSLDGVVVTLIGGFVVGASGGPNTRGADLSLLLGGVGLVIIGLLMLTRVRLDLARTGLAAITAGYFAVQLSLFEVSTLRCDVNELAPDCRVAGIVDPAPYEIFEAPVILAALLLVFLVAEPFARRPAAPVTTTAVPAPTTGRMPPVDIPVLPVAAVPAPQRAVRESSTHRPTAGPEREVTAFAVGAAITGIVGVVAFVLARLRRRR